MTIEDFIVIAMTAILGFLAYYARLGLLAFKERMEAAGQFDEWALIDAAIDRAILFVEGTMKGHDSQMKKDLAIATVSDWLAQNGIQINEEDIADRIEAAVYERFNDLRAV